MLFRIVPLIFAATVLSTGCTSVGNLGIVTKPLANNAEVLKSGTQFEELGPVEATACRHFIIAVIPFGNSALPKAVEKALDEKGGDALINVTVSTSLYGFVPIYNIYSFTCTTVNGIAVKFVDKGRR
jgi:hypothetical protein